LTSSTNSIADSTGYISKEVLEFSQQIVLETRNQFSEMKDRTENQVLKPHAYLLPTDPETAHPVISIEKAFDSPETNMACTEFLRETIVKENCKAALIVVQKESIAYPQFWKKKNDWKFDESQDGLFVQLETKDTPQSSPLRLIHFFPLSKNLNLSEEGFVLDIDKFGVMPPLFK